MKIGNVCEPTDTAVAAVERLVGHSCSAWDTVDPKRIIAAAWQLKPQFVQAPAPLMLNGLTEDETNATASVAGLSPAPAQPALPAPAYRIDAGSGGSIPGFSADQMQGFARAALAQSAQPALDPEPLIRACIPGGSVCDPQHVADAIRRYLDAWPQEQSAQAPAPAEPPFDQIEQARRNIAEWPQWMRDAACEASAHLPSGPAPAQPAPSVEAVMSGVMAVAEAAWNDGRDYRATQSENWSAETWDRYNAVRSAVEALAQAREDSDRAARYESSVAAQALADLREAREARGAR